MTFVIDDEELAMPEGFMYYGDSNMFSKFHILITYSFDIVTIACFGIEKETRRNVSFMVRYHVKKTLKTEKEALIKTIKTLQMADGRALFVDDKMDDVMNLTSVPNYALVAYKLGYVFDIF